MEKRKIIIGDYDTAADGLWTLTGWELSPAELVTNYLDIPGRVDGQLDASTILTDGEPRYTSRTFTATFESSEGTRLERAERISAMVNRLDGFLKNIVLPDNPRQYVVGRVRVTKLYSDPAHASVQVTATCEPWLYNRETTEVRLKATEQQQTAQLVNAGRRLVVPVLTITGGSVKLVFGDSSWALSPGSYILPDFHLKTGESLLTYSGDGEIHMTYREAVLQ